MKSENTFIAPPIISLRDAVKKLSLNLESRPKLPVNAPGESIILLNRFHDLQTRFGAILDSYEMELDRMLEEL